MFYGFGPKVEGYDDEKAWELANRLAAEFDFPTMDGNGPRPEWLFDGERKPYIQVGGMGRGVYIRRMTDLPDEEVDRIAKRADEIFKEVMK